MEKVPLILIVIQFLSFGWAGSVNNTGRMIKNGRTQQYMQESMSFQSG
jgi:hypothetical protein